MIKAAEPVIKARGAAVHYTGDFQQPVPHPVAVQSHQDTITYGAEKAEEAVRAMRTIYKALFEHPKAPVRLWLQQEEATLKQLANLGTT